MKKKRIYLTDPWILLLVLLFVGTAAFFVYLPALDNGFVYWDDFEYIVENENIRSLGLDNLRWMLLGYHASNWHPLTWLSLAVDYLIWGLNPFGYHLTNIILHALNTMLATALSWFLFVQVKGRRREAIVFAAIVGLLFGVHPIHVESVAWVAERKDVLYSLFYLACVVFYLRHHTQGRRFDYGVYLLMYLMALMSKPMAVSLPFVLLCLDYYPLGRLKPTAASVLEHVRSKWPMFVLAMGVAALTVVVQGKSGAMESMQIIGLGERVILAQWAVWFYLYKAFVPFGYIYFYPIPADVSFLNPWFSSTLILNCITIFACFRLSGRAPLLTVSALVFLVMLLPVLGIVQVGGQAAADRYMYLALLVPAVLVAACLVHVHGKLAAHRGGQVALWAPVILSLLVLSSLTMAQVRTWRSTTDLAGHALAHSPDNNHAYTMLANDQYRRGLHEEAVESASRAMALNAKNPYRAAGTRNWYLAFRGRSLLELERYEEAIRDFSSAIAIDNTLAGYFVKRASAYEKTGKLDEALQDYADALRIEPKRAELNNQAALVAFRLGRHLQAIEYLNEAIRLKPEEGVFYFNRALNYGNLGNTDRAKADLQAAAALGVQRAKELLRDQP